MRFLGVFFIWFILFAIGFTPSPVPAQLTALPNSCIGDLGDIGTGPPDPGVPGPFDVVIAEYGGADQTVALPDFNHPVEFLAEVAYPEQTECGPFPIVFMMHGANETCVKEDNSVDQDWPCEDDEEILPNYQGYRYLAEILASHGIVAVSISANGINAGDVTNLDARARLFQRHIGHWLEFSTLGSADFGQIFVGKIDLKRIGILGHSRGGGGAARLVDLIETSPSPGGFLSGNGNSNDINAVLLIGAVEGTDEDHEVTETALGVLLPYCDGDQQDMSSVAYYDASRYALPGDSGPKHTFTVMGANHNFFNTFWDPNETSIPANDDWDFLDAEYCVPDNPDSGRLSSEEQRGSLIAIGSAFFRTYLRNEKAFRPFLTSEAPPPPSAMTEEIYVAYHPKDEPQERLDVNRLTDKFETVQNTVGGMVESVGLRLEYCDAAGDGGPNGCLTDAPPPIELGNAPHAFFPAPANQLRIGWYGSPAGPFVINDIPAEFGDVSGYRALQFRAFVDFTDPLNPFGQDQDFRIVLVDGAGLSASAIVSEHARALFFPPADEVVGDAPVPRAILNTVRVPLSAFDGIFLTDIRSVVFIFDHTQTGAINIADIAFADEAENAVPQLSCTIAESQLMFGGNKMVDVGLSVAVEDDHDTGFVPTIAVFSDEDDLDSETPQSSPDAKDIADGTLRLRAERDRNEDGRVYLVLARAQDSQGALGHACCTATVPNGNSEDDFKSVSAQATAAQQQCTSFAAAAEGLAAIPAGFFVVGDGPLIGGQQ